MSDLLATQTFGRGERGDGGRFNRQVSAFRDWVSADGSSEHPAEAGRYHLYVSLACPWAHRAVILRELKGLQETIGMSIVDPIRDEHGWAFTGAPGTTADEVNGWSHLSEGYLASDPDFDARVTVPVLWDTQTGRIVNNESADIVRMLNREFDEWGDDSVDLYPADLRGEIDSLNERIYEAVNNGVYAAGFATTQKAYHRAFSDLFVTLGALELVLAARRYLTGDRITEADRRLFVIARALRRRLLLALQMQPATDRRLPEPLGLHARAVPVAGRRRDRRSCADQGALLRHSSKPEPDANHP